MTNIILLPSMRVPTTLESQLSQFKSKLPLTSNSNQTLSHNTDLKLAVHAYALWTYLSATPTIKVSDYPILSGLVHPNGDLSPDGEKLILPFLSASAQIVKQDCKNYMVRIEKSGVPEHFSQLIARTFADTMRYGHQYLDFKVRVIEHAMQSPAKGKVLYPGACDDTAQALLIPAKDYVIHDPYYSREKKQDFALENWAHTIMKYGSRDAMWFQIELKSDDYGMFAVLRLEEGVNFTLYPRAFESSSITEKVSAIVIKKPNASLLSACLSEIEVARLASMLEPGGLFLYSDWEYHLAKFETIATTNGLVAIERGALNSERVFDDGSIDDYPAVLFRKI